MNKLQKILGIGAIALNLVNCSPAKLEYSGDINGEKVEYYEKLILSEGFTFSATYDLWSTYKINVTKKDGTQVKYICNSRNGELILKHKQIIDGKTTKDYYKDEVLSTDVIKAGQLEVNSYIEKIRALKE